MLVDDQKLTNFINKKLIEVTNFAPDIIDFTLPKKALTHLKKNKPDLIFLDLNMPLVDGWQFLDTMRNKGIKTKVIILTSSMSNQDKERAKEYESVVEFLTKPLTLSNIIHLKSTICAS